MTNTQFTDQQFTEKPTNRTASPTERIVFSAIGSLMVLGAARRVFPTGRANVILGTLGGALLFNAARGYSVYDDLVGIRRTNEGGGIHVKKSITILEEPRRLYEFWRQYENLPQFMSHLQSVSQRDARVSHWVAKAPAGLDVSWDAETIEDVPGERIAWKAIEGSTIPNEGHVEFRRAPGDKGTEVHVELQYFPPGGTLGAGVARLFGEEPGQQVEDDLRRLKRLMEVGFEPTIEGQSTGKRGLSGKMAAALYDSERTK
ncbi:SRPBCC family protein [Deinococcus yavapaiensis]|uniref:Putative membrane protein n=1 Tax=Deinococcus yavapaiensis KR-236 TaxID=694435 RepID=A0A318S701_9DEIO|nr:SRPBCC family protein [Deinococcus yavapaiensis]PYE53545.1 putative membrane protein [Deinococcus yavapaiensis KR-236]